MSSYDELVKRLSDEVRIFSRTPVGANLSAATDAITALQARVAELEAAYVARGNEVLAVHKAQRAAEAERDALRHDIGRYVAIAAKQAQEVEELQSDLAAARALLKNIRTTHQGLLLHEQMTAIDATLAGEKK